MLLTVADFLFMNVPLRFTLFPVFFVFQIILSQTVEADDIGSHEKWEYILEDTGDVLQLALPLAAGITTVIKKDWQGTKQFALSYGTSIIVTHSLKRIVRKQRPEGRNLYDAFPSGHTTSAFSGASFIQRRYGWKYAKWAYVLAAIVGVSRMEGPDGWHDIWDVLAGATVGIGSTYIFTKPYETDQAQIGFSANNGTYVIGFRFQF
ncbi:phosphatase PAP2 family protein [Aequorivita todarodis]|uniref:phosphatase PAP2 family protein n=1 Tax=Aequorivita todarodis TaxID=2036821 RepID=UPI00234FF1CA|nr:phosphatase PAP2 family protein [Aequorivita todarodis]MDC8000716.1 phosphatase PAP2 family protein [Aequorivita todarodis]